jgi:dTDP-4-amino-4,6-dideoxygalactose transaminase
LTRWRVPLSDLDLGPEEIDAMRCVLESRWLTMGPRTEEFEAAFAQHHGASHAIAVSNGTAALHLSYAGLGVSSGHEVILPSLTFVATANAALLCGARPVFADIVSPQEPTIDPAYVESLITPRTRLIVAVHYGGYACRMTEILDLAARHQVPVVEDCAHAPGAMDGERYLGTWGSTGCFSFFSNKNLTTGEGGMIIAADDKLAARLRRLRSHGMTSGTWQRYNERPSDYDVTEPGWNYRIDELRSALGLVQLGKLARSNARRLELTATYRHALKETPGVEIAFAEHRGATACHLLPLVTRDDPQKQAILSGLSGTGIQTSHHYPPIHLFSYYAERFGFRPGMLPQTESFAAREITLPLHPGLTRETVEEIAGVIRDALHLTAGNRGGVGQIS